jgi:hypothetical protein
MHKTLLGLGVVILLCLTGIAATAADTNLSYLAGSLPKNEPQAIYADDPNDSWNRIFHCLFTRTLKIRLSEDFPEGAPFKITNDFVGRGKKLSARQFERIESGDHAAEPLYPHEMFRDDVSAAQLLSEPRFSEFKSALTDALAEQSIRPAPARALMQNDVWAAYDFLARDVSSWILKDAPIPLYHERQAELRGLLARFIQKLALSTEEIRTLPNNYAQAAVATPLPDLFSTNSPWLEVLWLTNRAHDRAAHGRRAARVFVKPAVTPTDKEKFIQSAHDKNFSEKLDAVALVIQNLLIDQTGKVVPSPITCAVQMRIFKKTAPEEKPTSRLEEYELSRRELLKNPASGGLKNLSGVPAYLPGAGNDYSYAAPVRDAQGPVAVAHAARCAGCHGSEGRSLFTFAIEPSGKSPPIRLLNPADNEHNWWVAGEKMKGDYFKKLIGAWK